MCSFYLLYQASVAVTNINASVGMSQVHLPCTAFERFGKAGTPQIEARWARQEGSIYQMVVVKGYMMNKINIPTAEFG